LASTIARPRDVGSDTASGRADRVLAQDGVTVSDHFKAWEAQGWTLGVLRSVHINVEVGGGTGSIEFPVAEVTTTSQ